MKNSILIISMIALLFSCSKDETTTNNNNGNNNNNNNTTVPERFQALVGIFDGNGIGAAVNLTEDIVILFNQDGDKYAWFEEGLVQAVYDLHEETGHFSDLPLSSVGAASIVSGSTIYLFDLSGETYCANSFSIPDTDEGWNNNNIFSFSNTTYALTQWGVDFSCPFNSIGAMWNYSNPVGCFEAYEENNYTWMVNQAGDEVSRYYFPDGGNFEAPEELENWLAVNTCVGQDGLLPFETISAACRYVSPNKIEEIFFNGDGTKFCFYTVSDGEFSEIYDLY